MTVVGQSYKPGDVQLVGPRLRKLVGSQRTYDFKAMPVTQFHVDRPQGGR